MQKAAKMKNLIYIFMFSTIVSCSTFITPKINKFGEYSIPYVCIVNEYCYDEKVAIAVNHCDSMDKKYRYRGNLNNTLRYHCVNKDEPWIKKEEFLTPKEEMDREIANILNEQTDIMKKRGIGKKA